MIESNMKVLRELPSPQVLKQMYPLPEGLAEIKRKKDEEIRKIFTGEDNRLILIIGPCSADREDAVLDYMHRLKDVADKVEDKIMMIPKFSWWYYANIAAEVNGKTLQYNVIETDDTFKYDFDSLERQVNEVRPKILLVATPNNPTGNGLTPTELEHLCDIVPKETIILVDEAYASYVTSDTLYIKHLVETRGNIVFCRTLSKFYGLPGLRLGFGFIGKEDEMEHFAKYANMYLGYDRLSEEVGIAALKSSDHYREIARVMQEARDMYTKEIGRLNGFKVYKSVANFILIKYPIHLKEKLQQAFADEDYKVKFMNEPDLNTHMRITLGRAEQNRTICDTILRIAHQ